MSRKRIDYESMVGQTFGKLTVIEVARGNRQTPVTFKCSCTCGMDKILDAYMVVSGAAKTCNSHGCREARHAREDLLGRRFGLLVATRDAGPSFRKDGRVHGRRWECQCDCGKKTIVSQNNLTRNHTTSCGCVSKELLDKQRARPWNEKVQRGPTGPQIALAEALGWPLEVRVRVPQPGPGLFIAPPGGYHIDIAHSERKIAIEVDGSMHKLPRVKGMDERKTETLEAMGWTVLRFANKRVLKDLQGCVAEVQAVVDKLAERED